MKRAGERTDSVQTRVFVAIAEGPRDAACQSESWQLLDNLKAGPCSSCELALQVTAQSASWAGTLRDRRRSHSRRPGSVTLRRHAVIDVRTGVEGGTAERSGSATRKRRG